MSDDPLAGLAEQAAHVRKPALLEHCEAVYAAMLQRAEYNATTECPIYTGHLTKLFTELRLSMPYYSKVMQAMQDMDCCRQLRRGGGGSASEWSLHQPPSATLWPRVRDTGMGSKNSPSGKTAALIQQNKDLATRVQRLEDAVFGQGQGPTITTPQEG